MTRILFVEDEEHIRNVVKLNLELEGYEVVEASNGKDALKYVEEQRFDLLLLDVMLPEADGFQICQKVRIQNNEVPILFLTAKDSVQDRIKGLRIGGDDYLVKPFNLEELLLRVKKLISRGNPKIKALSDELRFGNNQVNFKTFEARGNKGKFTLTKREAMLLKMLAENENEVISRQQILQTVWGYDVFPSTRTIDNFILSFRKYFEEDPKNPIYFHSVRGIGYKFKSSPVA